MSIVEPLIDTLLESVDQDNYLLCAISSKRARDINDMMRGQRDRAMAVQSVSEITEYTGRKPLSLSMEEIAAGEVSYDKEACEQGESQEPFLFERVCLVHYHEIGLKGHNRSNFEVRLVKNIEAALHDFSCEKVSRISGHLMVLLKDAADIDAVADILLKIPGIARVSRAWRTPREPQDYYKAAELALFDCGDFETFKVDAKRSNTDYPINSMELNQLVGANLCEFAPDKKVKMKNPDVRVHVEVIQGHVYVYSRTTPGIGGLPVGSAGKVVSLLSGGFDSPVASWQLMKRGAIVVGVHFSGRPQTSDSSEWQVDELAEALEHTGGLGRIYYIAFGDVQREIAKQVPEKLRIILYRRIMFRVAQKIAEREGAKALVTGESLGQVASQTLENIAAVNEVATIPVLRPLIGTDKQEIINLAQKIGTYAISEQQLDDCCTLFMPRSPETHAKLHDCEEAESELPIEKWVSELVECAEYKEYPCCCYKKPRHEFECKWHEVD